MATDNPTATPESESERSRALDLSNEIDRKLDQARAICDLIQHVQNQDDDRVIVDSASAASDLIEEGKKAADELWQLYRARAWPEAPKEVQS